MTHDHLMYSPNTWGENKFTEALICIICAQNELALFHQGLMDFTRIGHYAIHFIINKIRQCCPNIIIPLVPSCSTFKMAFQRTGGFFLLSVCFLLRTHLSLTLASSRANFSDTSLVESTRLCAVANSFDLLRSAPSSTNDFNWLVSWTRSDFTS